MGQFDIQKKNSTGLVPASKAEVTQPAPQEDVKPDATVKMELAQGSVEIIKKLIDGGVDIARIKAAGTQKIEEIKAEIAKMFAESQTRINEEDKRAQIWHDKFDCRKEVFFEAVKQINKMVATEEEKRLLIELLKEVLKNET